MATPGNDIIQGTSAADLIEGLAGDDTIFGSTGNDRIYGNAQTNPSASGESNTVVYAGSPSDYIIQYLAPPRTDPFYSFGKPDGSTDTLRGIQFVRFSGTGETFRIQDLPLSGGTIDGTPGNDVIVGRAGNDDIKGFDGSDVVIGSGGDDIINGFRTQVSPGESPFPLTDGVYDQVDYAGASSDYRFTGGPNNSVLVAKPNGGTDRLSYIEGIWFSGEAKWYALADLIEGAVINGGIQSDYLTGTRGNDIINAGPGLDTIAGSAGNDLIDGGGPEYDQVDYAGAASDYIFEPVGNAVRVTKPDGSSDQLSNIDGFWFSGEGRWYAIDDLVVRPAEQGTAANDFIFSTRANDDISGREGSDTFNASAGNDIFRGAGFAADGTLLTDTNYDQVDYDGSASDYRFRRNGGDVVVSKPDGSSDTLIGIDGFWFKGEEAWYSMASLLPGEAPIA